MEQKVHIKQCNTRFVLTTGSFPVILLAIVIYVVAKKVRIFSMFSKTLILMVAMVRKHERKCLKVGRPPCEVRHDFLCWVPKGSLGTRPAVSSWRIVRRKLMILRTWSMDSALVFFSVMFS